MKSVSTSMKFIKYISTYLKWYFDSSITYCCILIYWFYYILLNFDVSLIIFMHLLDFVRIKRALVYIISSNRYYATVHLMKKEVRSPINWNSQQIGLPIILSIAENLYIQLIIKRANWPTLLIGFVNEPGSSNLIQKLNISRLVQENRKSHIDIVHVRYYTRWSLCTTGHHYLLNIYTHQFRRRS